MAGRNMSQHLAAGSFTRRMTHQTHTGLGRVLLAITARRRVQIVARILAGALMLFSVVALNGRPVVFADTNIYDWMGQLEVRPLKYALNHLIGGPTTAASDPEAADETPHDMALRRTEMGARSVWFGLYLYGVEAVGSLWLLAGLQCLFASFCLEALWRFLQPPGRWGPFLVGMAGLSLGATLPFFCGFAMPDVFLGLGLVALYLLFTRWSALGGPTRWGLSATLFAALAVHATNPPVLFVAAATLLCLRRFAKRPTLTPSATMPWQWQRPAGLVVALWALVLGLNLAYGAAIKVATGESLRSPPFLAARILADGPGRTYLRTSCAQGVRWALCRYAGTRLTDSQDILWSGNPTAGVFSRADVATRQNIDREQLAFVLDAVASDPLGALRAAVGNAWTEALSVYLDDPLRDPHYYLTDPDWRDTFIADMVHRLSDCDPDERGCRPTFTEAQSRVWHSATCCLALLVIVFALASPRLRSGTGRQPEALRDAFEFATLVMVCLTANAVLTGALSGPFARYQARVSWLLPLAAILILQARNSNGKDAAHISAEKETGIPPQSAYAPRQ